MKSAIVRIVELVTLNRIRGQHRFGPAKPSLRWWWTPWTARFGHGGWVFLSLSWYRRFRGGAR